MVWAILARGVTLLRPVGSALASHTGLVTTAAAWLGFEAGRSQLYDQVATLLGWETPTEEQDRTIKAMMVAAVATLLVVIIIMLR